MSPARTWRARVIDVLPLLFADYLGQKSIVSIPYTSYTIGNVVGSVVVACAAVIVALYIMFIVLRPKLKHGWFIKVAIACILGAAVCCMHYIAMGGESASS